MEREPSQTSNEHSAVNREAWAKGPYQAWIERFGTPKAAAARIRSQPDRGLAPILDHLPPISGKRIVNIMGSHGTKAVALALLGARLTVIDASSENATYCRELATAAGVDVQYTVSDILEYSGDSDFEIAIAEMGIVHYFEDIKRFASAVASLINPGGTLLLRDFHPISTKLLTFRGSTAKVRKYKVTGNYFDTTVEELPAPFIKHSPTSPNDCGETTVPPVVRWRKWTLGEIVTAFASASFRIRALIEEPNRSSEVYDAGIPKTFTLVATRLEA